MKQTIGANRVQRFRVLNLVIAYRGMPVMIAAYNVLGGHGGASNGNGIPRYFSQIALTSCP